MSLTWNKLKTRSRYGWRELKVILGVDTRLTAPDRAVLENRILPHYGSDETIERVLFVGCAWYTHHYWKLFPGQEVWTIDSDPQKRKYATRFSGHVEDGLQRLDRHFREGFFDLIICNGVYGWGLNERKDVEDALNACWRCLRDGGDLVVGWDDTPKRNPVPFAALAALDAFERPESSPLGGSRHRVPHSHHVYDFFVRPDLSAS